MSLRIHRVRARTDNFIWLIEDGGACIAVDPADAAPVLTALESFGGRLVAIWNTHHHGDHVGGNSDLLSRFPGVPVYAGAEDGGRIPGQTHRLSDGDTLDAFGRRADVWFVPGHTRGHIAYVLRDGAATHLFSGDVLFGGGCGRLFEGTPAQMQQALSRIRALPDETLVHCAHEYTWHNLRWAITLEPQNAELVARHAFVAADPSQLTVPTRLGDEKATNPFLRWDSPSLMQLTGKLAPVDVFAALRAAKDVWRD
jgi:hydroxyacylglutathione hydrolase